MTWIIQQEYRKNGRLLVSVICNCGKEAEVRKDHVLSGRSKVCRSCSSKRKLERLPNSVFGPRAHTGIGDISKTLWFHIRNGAKRRNKHFEISMEYAWELFENQQKRCALSGAILSLKHQIRDGNVVWSSITASLDRINSQKGYEKDNVQWVHKDINRMKNKYSNKLFVSWCTAVHRFKGGECGS